MASSVRPRGYHNTSLLLPDGRILLAGSGRARRLADGDEKTAEIFSPPYLHKGPRPTITSAPRADGLRRQDRRRDAGRGARSPKVSLVRIGSVTHNFNMDQRWQQLNFRQIGGKLEIDAPTSPNIAPPGVYYVFLLNADGVPSKAAILSIYATAPTPPRPSQARPSAHRDRGGRARHAQLERRDRQRRRPPLRGAPLDDGRFHAERGHPRSPT